LAELAFDLTIFTTPTEI